MQPVEVVIKENEIAIYIDKVGLAEWMGVKTDDVPWEAPTEAEKEQAKNDNSEQDQYSKENQGYTAADGEKKELPNDADGRDKSQKEEEADTCEEIDGINLFDEGPTGQKGELQNAPEGKKKVKALRDWIKDQNFNYRNFCGFLWDLEDVAGFKLSTPVIGVTESRKEPTLLKVAYRFYSYWLSAKDEIAAQYKRYLLTQLEDMGITIQMVEKVLDGKEIDPKNLPKGIEVSV